MTLFPKDSPETIFPADPRLTAYALGELEGDELARIEAAVAADPALQAAVAELRAFSGDLATALNDEQLAEPVDGDLRAPSPKTRRGWVPPFPVHYFATAAAACFAVVVWINHDRSSPALEKATAADEESKGVAHLSESDHRLQLARKATAAPIASPVLAPETKDSVAALHEMPPLPTVGVGAGSLSGRGFEAPTPAVSSQQGMGFGSALGAAPTKDLGSARLSFVGRTTATPDSFAAAESYATQADNTQRTVASEPLSTFSIDVDTASYSNVRRFLTSGRLPPRDAVRVEELVNYFPYRYEAPTSDVPFAAHLEVASAPWAPAHRLVRIGLKGRELDAATRPAANLVFLIDVSGSMNSANKLPLVKESLRLLVERLRPDDRVAIVTYAGSSGLALPSTPASQKRDILAALEELSPNGSTNGAMGIHLAYDIAKANFATGGLNRVILCTDGDFNVGVSQPAELTRLIQEKAKSRVFLSVFGFGMGNLKDSTLESLADQGNGAYGYIDTRREAEKVFIEQLEGTLATIAKDVKVQVEFNPARVASYRLVGYENRILAKEDFNNDAVDAGDIGAGHTVTALYEIVPVGVGSDGAVRPMVDALKYQMPAPVAKRRTDDTEVVPPLAELLTVKVRYKSPEGDVSRKQEFPLIDTGGPFTEASRDFRFAAAVAAWGMVLRDSPHRGSATFEQVLGWAESGLGDDAGGHRGEFVQLVRRSAELSR